MEKIIKINLMVSFLPTSILTDFLKTLKYSQLVKEFLVQVIVLFCFLMFYKEYHDFQEFFNRFKDKSMGQQVRFSVVF